MAGSLMIGPVSRPRRVTIPSMIDWKPVSTARLVAALFGLVFLVFLYLHDADGYLLGLDDLNLAFHEAGHLIFGIFGATANLYGGTLGQLVFPAAVAVEFTRQREPVGVFFGSVWFCENLLNIARYAADARAQLLPLLGGGEHDWFNIFSRWGVLQHDTGIAGIIRGAGWLGMAFSAGWLIRLWNISDDSLPTALPKT